MKGSALAPYDQVVGVANALPVLLREARRARQLSIREAAAHIGASPSTVYRIEHGYDCALSSAVAVLNWLAKGAP